MGNAQSNKVDDHEKKKLSNRNKVPKSVHQQSSPDQYSSTTHLNMQQIQNQKQNLNDFEFEDKNALSQKEKSRYINDKNLIIQIQCKTWYRDSHGLFDYEEEQKMTHNKFNTNGSFLLKRDSDNIIKEDFDDFEAMRKNEKCIQQMVPPPDDYKQMVAAALFKDNNFWIYHKNTIENTEEEKATPGEKLWLCMKHMANDQDYNILANEGYKLGIGDTVKFGRVRYKVIAMHNQKDGLQEYSITDRFQKVQYINNQIKQFGRQESKRQKRRRSSQQSSGTNIQVGVLDQNQSPAVNLHRYQSQATQFDQDLAHCQHGSFDAENDINLEGSMYGSEDQPPGSSEDDNSSQFTDSEEHSHQEIDNLQTMQNVENNQQDANDSDELVPIRAGLDPNINVGRYNSVVPEKPTGALLEESQRERASVNIENDVHASENGGFGLHNPRDRQMTHTHNDVMAYPNLDPNDLGRTGTFWFAAQSGVMQSGIGSDLNENQRLVAPGNISSQPNTGQRNLAATQTNLGLKDTVKRKKRKNDYKRQQKNKLKLKLEEQAKLAMEGKVCRICLGDENEGVDPLISPCKCAGTMSHIHLECLREWLNSKRSKKEGENVRTYCWKALECELCKVRFPGQVYPDGTILTETSKMSKKQVAKLGQPIEILEYERPESDFLVVESVTLQNIRIVHVIAMKDRNFIRVGRGHDADIRVTDISVSRFHALINRNEEGEYFVEDNKSKFGTLMQIRKPHILFKNRMNYIQMGRTMLQIRIDDQDLIEQSYKSNSTNLCQKISEVVCHKKTKKITKGIIERQQELYPLQWDPHQETFLEAEEKILQTQAVEQTRDEDAVGQAQASPIGELHANPIGTSIIIPDSAYQINQQPILNLSISQIQNQQQNEEEKQLCTNEQETIRNQMQSRILFQEGSQGPYNGPQINQLSNLPGTFHINSEQDINGNLMSLGGDQVTVRGGQELHGIQQERNSIIVHQNDTVDESNIIKLEGNDSCAIVNDSMFEEQKTDNNINIKQNILDQRSLNKEVSICQNSEMQGRETSIKSKGERQANVQILDFQNGSSYTEQLDINSNDVSRILNVGHFGTGTEQIGAPEFATNIMDTTNLKDEPSAQKSRFGNNESILDLSGNPVDQNKELSAQISPKITVQGQESLEDTQGQENIHELIGGMKTGLNNKQSFKMANAMAGDELEQTYLNDELIGNGLRTSQQRVDISQNDGSVFDTSQLINLSPSFTRQPNKLLGPDEIHQSQQIEPRLLMNVETENNYQTKDKGALLSALKEEDNTGQSTMKNSSLIDQNFEEEKSGQPTPVKPDTINVEQKNLLSTPAQIMQNEPDIASAVKTEKCD